MKIRRLPPDFVYPHGVDLAVAAQDCLPAAPAVIKTCILCRAEFFRDTARAGDRIPISRKGRFGVLRTENIHAVIHVLSVVAGDEHVKAGVLGAKILRGKIVDLRRPEIFGKRHILRRQKSGNLFLFFDFGGIFRSVKDDLPSGCAAKIEPVPVNEHPGVRARADGIFERNGFHRRFLLFMVSGLTQYRIRLYHAINWKSKPVFTILGKTPIFLGILYKISLCNLDNARIK